MEEKASTKQLPWLVALVVYHWSAFWLWLYHQSLVHVYNLRQCKHCGGYFYKVAMANDSATTCQACFLEGWRSYSAGE
jgi:hypothetical protein